MKHELSNDKLKLLTKENAGCSVMYHKRYKK